MEMTWEAIGVISSLFIAILTLIINHWQKLSSTSTFKRFLQLSFFDKISLFFIIIAFCLTGYIVIGSLYPEPPREYKFDSCSPLERVRGRYFSNQQVPLDGYEYTDCTFDNVSFIYDGITPISFSHNTVQGYFKIETNNPAFHQFYYLLERMGYINKDVDFIYNDQKQLELK